MTYLAKAWALLFLTHCFASTFSILLPLNTTGDVQGTIYPTNAVFAGAVRIAVQRIENGRVMPRPRVLLAIMAAKREARLMPPQQPCGHFGDWVKPAFVDVARRQNGFTYAKAIQALDQLASYIALSEDRACESTFTAYVEDDKQVDILGVGAILYRDYDSAAAKVSDPSRQ